MVVTYFQECNNEEIEEITEIVWRCYYSTRECALKVEEASDMMGEIILPSEVCDVDERELVVICETGRSIERHEDGTPVVPCLL